MVDKCVEGCYEIRLLQNRNAELMDLLLDLGKEVYSKWYSYNDIEGYRRYMSLMFTLENPERGEKFNNAVKSANFPILNHFLLNTELGKEIFPNLTLKNLRVICLHKNHRW